jgi:hypothetical protein
LAEEPAAASRPRKTQVSPEIREVIESTARRLYLDPVEAFSIDEFCRRYGIGRQLAYDEIKAGRLKVIKRGRRTLVRRVDAAEWLALDD